MRNRIENYTGRIVIVCTVCTTPMFVPIECENAILRSQRVVCKFCKQTSKISNELKRFIISGH
jgi:hypothetical protein